jgi:hypothetical protein
MKNLIEKSNVKVKHMDMLLQYCMYTLEYYSWGSAVTLSTLYTYVKTYVILEYSCVHVCAELVGTGTANRKDYAVPNSRYCKSNFGKAKKALLGATPTATPLLGKSKVLLADFDFSRIFSFFRILAISAVGDRLCTKQAAACCHLRQLCHRHAKMYDGSNKGKSMGKSQTKISENL